MLRASRARCTCLGLLWILYACFVDGYIEIVEEQQCHDFRFRLTCRDLDSHIAVLEAWYTSFQVYQEENTTSQDLRIKTENDSELNRVYAFSSPKHNGVYEPLYFNFTENNNRTSINVNYNNTLFNSTLLNVNSSLEFSEYSDVNDTVDMSVELVNNSACEAVAFSRSYGSWREGDKRKIRQDRSSSLNLRSPLSYRCSGVNHCSFVPLDDYSSAVSWSAGVVYIKYACFDDTLSIHYCNREVTVAATGEDSEGYIRTPGYPNFYVGDECRWRLRANPNQRIQVTLLDVSLRTIGPFETSCKDYVAVVDSNGDQLLSSCEQVELPLRLLSTTNIVEVLVEAKSQGAYPKRGVLLHYKSIGCVTLPPPSDGYIVYRNEEVAHYMCNVNYVFVDTRQRARLLWCYDDNRWNDTVPLCIADTPLWANDSSSKTSEKEAKLPTHEQPDMIVDIVIPSLLIAALFIGNAFIVLIIYKYRKRKNDDIDDEFNTIPLSANGNVHSAGNAV